MAELTQKIEILLDKLYNLKGDDNIIIKELVDKISETKDRIEISDKNRENSELNKINCEGNLELFSLQKKSFQEAFEGLDNETFSALRCIDVVLDIGTMLKNIEERSPKYCADLQDEINKYQLEIDTAISERNQLESILNDLEDKKEKSEDDRSKLVGLLEQSLSSDDIERESLTAYYVKKIVSQFGVFSDEELGKLTKLIMFPDEGLYQFDKTYADRLSKGKVGHTEVEPETEAPTEIEREPLSTEKENTNPPIIEDIREIEREEVTEPHIEKTETIINEEENTIELTPTPVVDDVIEDIAKPEIEEVENIEGFLNRIGIKTDRLKEENSNDYESILSLLESSNQREIEENYEILRSISLDDLAYVYKNNYMYVTDSDLNRKITLLRAKGISENKIKELLHGTSLRVSFAEIEEKVEAITKTYHRLEDDNANLLGENIVQYTNNLEKLSNSGYELDEKEIRNNNTLLSESANVSTDINILKDYLISIAKNNGKYALSIFWKKPEELLEDIDTLIENDLEEIITSNPETLAVNVKEILRRVRYCEEKEEPIYEGSGKSEFCDYISSYIEFSKKFGTTVDLPSLPSKEIANTHLSSTIGNEELVGILNKKYQNVDSIVGIKIVEGMENKYRELKNLLEERLQARITGKCTYKIDDICISKNKYERNLIIILNELHEKNKPLEGLEKEIVLVSALYNLTQDEEKIKNIVDKYNGENAVGGVL